MSALGVRSGDYRPFGDQAGEIASCYIALHVKPASRAERQAAMRRRLELDGPRPDGRDPIDVELTAMLRAGR